MPETEQWHDGEAEKEKPGPAANPATSQMDLVSINKEFSLDTLAAMADQMTEYSGNTTIAAVTSERPNQVAATQFEILSKQLEKLTLEVAELRSRSTYRDYRRARARSHSRRSRSRRRAPQPGDPTWLCKYHFRFGDRAKKCESQCTYVKTKEN